MDRVKLEALERADLEDVKALTDLAYEYDQRALGAVLGSADLSANDGGLLSGPSLSYAHATGLLTLSSFTFLELTEGDAPTDANGNSLSPEARVIRYDNSASGNVNAPVDISAARTVSVTYTLYARSIRIESDTSARRRWDISSAQEVSYSPTTRFRERVEFSAGTTQPAESTSAEVGKWTPLFTYQVDGSNTLTHTPISALDHADARAVALLNPSDDPLKLSTDAFLNASSTGTQGRAFGLLGMLSTMKHLFYRTIHKGSSDTLHTALSSAKWWTGPLLSLGEIKERIERLETRTAGVKNLFPFMVEIQINKLSGSYNENVRIIQTDESPFTNELTVTFDNRYRTAGTAPSAFDGDTDSNTGILRRIGHPVFIFDSSFNGGDLFLFNACHTTHTVRDGTNTSTLWTSITGSQTGAASKNIAYSLLEETELSDGASPAPRASSIGSRSYYDDSGALQTAQYAIKASAHIDQADLDTDATDNEGLTVTINYMLLVRR